MKTVSRVLAAAAAAMIIATPMAMGAGKYRTPEQHNWSFNGPFGQYDRQAVQRGYQVYQQVCAACHGIKHLSIRHLGMPGGPFEYLEINGERTRFPNPNDNPAVVAIAEDLFPIEDIDDIGDVIERPRRPSDPFPYPYANEAQGRAANGGAYPPDLSVIVKGRHYGANYIRSLLMGYDQEVPEDVDVRPGNYYNPYMPGMLIAMPPVLMDDMVEYADGTPATIEQMANDVTYFLAWAADPHMESRKSMGFMVMGYLFILALLLYASYRKIWSRVKH
ncbi:cytochrome c1 [Alkalicaulis satelles]|uniref:Cytochrome c1 n=1 Tax=Alkalicaulis satelles TaxID=2609175 RepID=A0A5M6ZCD0_9PROT|nr:cytochrome c1 [Alkalicaulis satelles]KAA5802416.1 cytochrome c1 [Alkalicaulis satelles]